MEYFPVSQLRLVRWYFINRDFHLPWPFLTCSIDSSSSSDDDEILSFVFVLSVKAIDPPWVAVVGVVKEDEEDDNQSEKRRVGVVVEGFLSAAMLQNTI